MGQTVSPLQRLEYALNDAGLGRGVTRGSIQRFYGVNAASAMILMVLREACFGVLATPEAAALESPQAVPAVDPDVESG